MTVVLEQDTPTHIPKGCWRNIYWCAVSKRCGTCGEIMKPGRVIGCRSYPSRELAEEEALRKSRIKPPDRYLGAEFFPEK